MIQTKAEREDKWMLIRRACENDIEGINKLLCQVLMVHHNGRPDLFKANVKKYTDEELKAIIADDSRPIFVAVNDVDNTDNADGRITESVMAGSRIVNPVNKSDENVLGYAFCIHQQHIGNNILTDVKTLYIDDLCVDENMRGQHIGKKIYDYVLAYAKENNYYNVTLNVWSCNEAAMKFYEKCGLKPQKVGMEAIL